VSSNLTLSATRLAPIFPYVGCAIPPLINAHAALRTFAWSPAQDLRRSSRETATAAGTAEPKAEHADDTDEQEPEDDFPKYMVVPGGLPTPGQHADRQDADPEKAKPASECLSYGHANTHRCPSGQSHLHYDANALSRSRMSTAPRAPAWSRRLRLPRADPAADRRSVAASAFDPRTHRAWSRGPTRPLPAP
jgi:hypothetical protein